MLNMIKQQPQLFPYILTQYNLLTTTHIEAHMGKREWTKEKNHIKLIIHRWRWILFCVGNFCCHFLIDDNKVTEDRNYEISVLFGAFATEMNDFIPYFIRRHPSHWRWKRRRRKPLPYLLASQFSNEKLIFGFDSLSDGLI